MEEHKLQMATKK